MAFVVECCNCHEKQKISSYEILNKEKIKILIGSGEGGYADIDLICKSCDNTIESDNGL